MVAGLLLCAAWYYTIISGFFVLYCPVMYLMFFSHRLYRKFVDALFALWELYPVALFQCCCDTKLHHFGDYVNANEKTIIIMNHRTRVDWNYVWIALYHATQNPAQDKICTCKQHALPTDSSNPFDIGGKSKTKFVLKDEIKNIPAMAKKPPPGDIIENSIGALGRYHWWLMFIIFINKIPVGQQQIAIVFLAPPIKFSCDGIPDKCPCDDPLFDNSTFQSTITTEWKLICEKKTLVSLAQMIIQFGTLIGSLLFGTASDRFGRKWPLIIAICIYLTAGMGTTFAPTYWIFNICRFFTGAAIGGIMVGGFVILMEFTAMRYRGTVSALYQAPFNLGTLTLPLISYYLRNFRDYHLAIVAPASILLMYFCVLPESPRWLLAVNKTDEAIKILTRVAKIFPKDPNIKEKWINATRRENWLPSVYSVICSRHFEEDCFINMKSSRTYSSLYQHCFYLYCNRLPTANIEPNVRAYQATIDSKSLKKGTILDLFKTPNIRKNSLAMAFQWFTCSYCFYGVAQYISHLTADIFVNVTASMSLVLFGDLCSVLVIRYMGRKPMLLLGQGTTAVCFFALACIPPAHIAAIVLASIGVVAAFMVFILVYLYSSELFPTVLRSAAVGFASMIARIGSMIAPFVIDTKEYGVWVPPVIFAIVPAISVVIAFLLPETKDRILSNTIEEGEALGKKPPKETKPKPKIETKPKPKT